MRIGLVADPCDPKKPGGLGRYVYELVNATLAAGQEHTFIVFSKKPLPGIKAEQRPLPQQVWLKGSRFLDPTLDLYIFFTPVIPLFFRPRRSIVIAQDFAYLDLPHAGLRDSIRTLASYLMQRRSLRLADCVVGISQATTTDAIRHFNLAKEKCIAIPIAAMPAATPIPVTGLPPRFFLFAGVLKERKNVATLIRAFARFGEDDTQNYQFLIAGKKEGAYYESLLALARELGVSERIHFLGYVSDGELSYVYAKATALIFASFIEGFGMPVLEAMHAGLPVITSNEGALAEVAGDAALLVDPRSPEAIARAMQRIAIDVALRQELIEKGKKNATRYTWGESAQKLAAVIATLQK